MAVRDLSRFSFRCANCERHFTNNRQYRYVTKLTERDGIVTLGLRKVCRGKKGCRDRRGALLG